jgi:hypothetical protein
MMWAPSSVAAGTRGFVALPLGVLACGALAEVFARSGDRVCLILSSAAGVSASLAIAITAIRGVPPAIHGALSLAGGLLAAALVAMFTLGLSSLVARRAGRKTFLLSPDHEVDAFLEDEGRSSPERRIVSHL